MTHPSHDIFPENLHLVFGVRLMIIQEKRCSKTRLQQRQELGQFSVSSAAQLGTETLAGWQRQWKSREEVSMQQAVEQTLILCIYNKKPRFHSRDVSQGCS